MVQINYVVGLCLVFLSLAFLSLAHENAHDSQIDARHMLFGRPIMMSIPASALPPSHLTGANQPPPCHSVDAQYPASPCSQSLYAPLDEPEENPAVAIPPFWLNNLFGHRGNRFVTPDIYRYPFANNNFRQDSQFPTVPEEDVPSQYA